MNEFVIALIMFSPAIAGISIIVCIIVCDIKHKIKKKKQNEKLDFLAKNMGQEKYLEFLKLLKDCYNPEHAIDYACKQYEKNN